MVPTNEVRPYWRNPRSNREAIGAVKESIRQFGWRQPIVVDSENVIVVGDTRWRAARALRMEQVPVHVATDLSDAQIQAYRIADNRLHEIAEWDAEALAEELNELEGAKFDLDILGFTEKELNAALRGDEPRLPKSKGGEVDLGAQYQILIECADETEQVQILERLKADKINCRALIA
jgi:ParB-like chromosome segregation protein Spo0J